MTEDARSGPALRQARREPQVALRELAPLPHLARPVGVAVIHVPVGHADTLGQAVQLPTAWAAPAVVTRNTPSAPALRRSHNAATRAAVSTNSASTSRAAARGSRSGAARFECICATPQSPDRVTARRTAQRRRPVDARSVTVASSQRDDARRNQDREPRYVCSRAARS